jgi:hypothetical protein
MLKKRNIWMLSGIATAILVVGATGFFLTHTYAASGSQHSLIEQFKQQKEAKIASILTQHQKTAGSYAASYKVTQPTIPAMAPKPNFTPHALTHDQWYSLPWINRSDANQLPTSVWIVDYQPVPKTGEWVPLYATAGDTSTTDYIALNYLSPLGGISGNEYNAPSRIGAITITGVSQHLIYFSTTQNHAGTFNMDSHKWTIN